MTKIPPGFRAAGVSCGVKSTDTEDLSLIAADAPCVAAGVYTQNQIVAAPVLIDRQRTPSDQIRAVVVNSGNANACTGEIGLRNAEDMVQQTANLLDCRPDQVLVMSTGIIGEQLPMEKIGSGIRAAATELGNSPDHLLAAARGILTTDTKTKIATASLAECQIIGIAKGSGMIGPNMATMLGVIMTNASLSPDTAQTLLRAATELSFNAINVDGHTSTNDTVLLLASGRSEPFSGNQQEEFAEQLQGVCVDLAKQIVIDGEGASHLVEIRITGARSDADARMIAKAIANSPLVKTAIAGNDPNWGRIVSAAGYAGPSLEVDKTTLRLNATTLFQNGGPTAFDGAEVANAMRSQRDVFVELCVGNGDGMATFWTCDLTHEYVTINADYHT